MRRSPARPIAWPSIWSPGQVRAEKLEITDPDPFEWIDAAPWLSRAKRLAAVIANPDPYAARVARWLQRARAMPKGVIGRRIPLRPFALMPGYASAALDRTMRPALHYSDAGAIAALGGAWDSS